MGGFAALEREVAVALFFPRIQFLRAAQKICANILQKVDMESSKRCAYCPKNPGQIKADKGHSIILSHLDGGFKRELTFCSNSNDFIG